MPTIAYEGIYVAMPWIFRTTNTTHHPELAFSRDGVHYRRDFRAPFIDRGHPLDFDGTSIYSRVPIVHGDRILVFYSGTNWRSPEQLLELGDRATAAIGLATVRLDGFVSLDGAKGTATDVRPMRGAAPEYSEVVTRSFSFSGSRLHLNVETALQQWGPRRAAGAARGAAGAQPRLRRGIPVRGRRSDDVVRPRQRGLLGRQRRPERVRGQGSQAALLLQELQALLVPVRVGLPLGQFPGGRRLTH